MHAWLRPVVVGVLGVLAVGCASDRSASNTSFQKQSFVYDGKSRNYAVYTPPGYDARKQYPTILFLHGLFENGNDGHGMTTVGLGPALKEHADLFHCVVVFPQTSDSWRDDDQLPMAIATLDDAEKRFGIDPNRIVLTGVSTGGAGVWKLGAAYPDRFAALAPLCAFSDESDASKLTKLPVWAFHNRFDPIVGVWNTSSMAKAVNDAGGHVRETIYGAFGHDCWDETYSNPKVIEWLQSQVRHTEPQFATNP